jgi:uncharacterized protein with PQ loop repeat
MHFGRQHFYSRLRRSPAAALRRRERIMDALVYAVSLLGPLFTLDQAAKIWVEHNAQGVSALTWGFYTVSACVWLAYGIVHRQKVIIFANVLWVVINSVIALGIVLYS